MHFNIKSILKNNRNHIFKHEIGSCNLQYAHRHHSLKLTNNNCVF